MAQTFEDLVSLYDRKNEERKRLADRIEPLQKQHAKLEEELLMHKSALAVSNIYPERIGHHVSGL